MCFVIQLGSKTPWFILYFGYSSASFKAYLDGVTLTLLSILKLFYFSVDDSSHYTSASWGITKKLHRVVFLIDLWPYNGFLIVLHCLLSTCCWYLNGCRGIFLNVTPIIISTHRQKIKLLYFLSLEKRGEIQKYWQ